MGLAFPRSEDDGSSDSLEQPLALPVGVAETSSESVGPFILLS